MPHAPRYRWDARFLVQYRCQRLLGTNVASGQVRANCGTRATAEPHHVLCTQYCPCRPSRIIPNVQHTTPLILLVQYDRRCSRLCRQLPVVPTYQTHAVQAASQAQSLPCDIAPGIRCARPTWPFPKSKSSHDHVLVIRDRFTKFIRAIPLRSITSQVVTDAFLTY